MMQVYEDKRLSLSALSSKKIAVLGFGSQGRAQALNLKDSGLTVCIGLRAKSRSHTTAKNLGFQVWDIATAVMRSDIILVLLPDEAHPDVFQKEILPHWHPSKILGFAHGFSIVFKTIGLPKNSKYFLLAPKGPGYLVREKFLEGSGVAAAVAWGQAEIKSIALAYGKAIGATRALLFKTTFEEEVFSNLFSEQCVLPGGINEILKKGFEVLVEAGISPLMAYFECFYKLPFVADFLQKKGFSGTAQSISPIATYGALSQGPFIIDASTKHRMKVILQNIKKGTFAKSWLKEYQKGQPHFRKLLEQEKNHPLEKFIKQKLSY
ncbi:MAG: ketol-acid reductoisomerase [Deltaproteobacteria bacterium]|nr:ketol-acid reductoisomerase [Deltaproteobacteria bacterium]